MQFFVLTKNLTDRKERIKRKKVNLHRHLSLDLLKKGLLTTKLTLNQESVDVVGSDSLLH